MKIRWQAWVLLSLVLPLFLAGCVSPATARKIDVLETSIKDVAKRHQAGELPTSEAVTEIKALVTQVEELKKSGESVWNMLGYWVLTTLGTVIGARKLGIPGIAHGTGLPFTGGGS